jgi:TetR/AcrR family transcriptional regulator, cholesterol catabolism regulator
MSPYRAFVLKHTERSEYNREMASPPESPALRARYDLRQRAVINTVAKVFANQGFHATSIQDLVEATGLKAGGLYHYIGSKDELLVQICNDLMDPLLESVREILTRQGSARTQLSEIMRTWVTHVERNHDQMLVFQQERHVLAHGTQWGHVRQQRKEFEELLAEVLAHGERDGEFRFADRDLALRALLGMVNQLPQWFRRGGRFSAEEVAVGYMEIVVGR